MADEIKKNLISDDGLDGLIQQLHDTTQDDIKEVEGILKSFKDEIFTPSGINTTSLQIYQESLSEILKTKIQTKDQLFKVANLLSGRLKEIAKVESVDKTINFADIKSQIEKHNQNSDSDYSYDDDDDDE